MRFALTVIFVIEALVLSGCLSAPAPRFYTLDMTPSVARRLPYDLIIQNVETADALRREAIMVRTSPTTIEYYAVEQWVAGTHEMVQQKLEAEFGPTRPDAPDVAVHVFVRALEQVDDAAAADARVALDIELRPMFGSRHSAPLFEKRYEVALPAAAPTAGAAVEALSRCLEAIAAEIIDDVSVAESRILEGIAGAVS